MSRIKLTIDSRFVSDAIISFLREQQQVQNFKGAVVGLSGGIDSAVVAALAVNAFEPSRVRTFFLPERDSHPQSREDALLVARKLGLQLHIIDIEPALKELGIYKGAAPTLLKYPFFNRAALKCFKLLGAPDPFKQGLRGYKSRRLAEARAFYRIKHRLRMSLLYYEAEIRSYMVAGCLNRTEYLTGFFVPFGDAAADVFPLLPFYKTEVKQLAEYLEIPAPVIDKEPTPDLLPGLSDEFILGIGYDKIDLVLCCLEKGFTPPQTASEVGISLKAVLHLEGILKAARPLRQPAPYPRGLRPLL